MTSKTMEYRIKQHVSDSYKNACDIFHFTHTDLDGISCSVVWKLLSGELRDVEPNQSALTNTVFVHELRSANEVVANLTIARLDTRVNEGNTRGITVIVTDIGGLDPYHLVQMTSCAYPNIPVNFIIVDHHRLTEMSPDVPNYYMEYTKNNHTAAQYINTDYCGTKLLFNIMYTDARKGHLHDVLGTYVDHVNNSDLGRFGSLKYPHHREAIDDMVASGDISPAFIYRTWFQAIGNNFRTDRRAMCVSMIETVIGLIQTDVTNKRFESLLLYDRELVHSELQKFAQGRIKFESDLIEYCAGEAISELNPDISVHEILGLDDNIIIKFLPAYSNGNMFFQYCTTIDSTADTVVIKMIFNSTTEPTLKIFSLWSPDTGINVGAVARNMGGGGHIHAAGFSVALN